MARPQNIDDQALLAALADVFRDYGYEGASLGRLSEAAGMQKASLYHRFPGGKKQMAAEVLASAFDWLDANILTPAKSDKPLAERFKKIVVELRGFYECGRKACLLNTLSLPIGLDGPFAAAIRRTLEMLIDAFAGMARESGLSPRVARRRAETAVALLQGSLVLSRGLGDERLFERFLAEFPAFLLGESRPN